MNADVPPPIARPYSILFTLAVLGFIMVPISTGGGLSGEHFQIGWPFPTLAAKSGWLTPDGPRGLHFFWSFGVLLNLPLWAGVYLGIRRLAAKEWLPDWLLYPGIIIFFSLSLVMCLLCGFWLLVSSILG